MTTADWKQLFPDPALFRGPGRYAIEAYSEFMPPPRLAWKPYGESTDPLLFDSDEPWSWHVSEYEEANELSPGLEQVASQLVARLRRLYRGEAAHVLSRRLLDDNLYWSAELEERRTSLQQERCVLLLPLALSRTQDDKGRVRWTLFGNSEQGPSKAFWKSFSDQPGRSEPDASGPRFIARLLQAVYGETAQSAGELLRAGFRVLAPERPPLALWETPLPPWTEPFLLDERAPASAVKYLLTFRPFGLLPESVRHSYLDGRLHLLPTPASLLFWGSPRFHQLHQALPLGLQAPLLPSVARHRVPHGLRVPQAGLLHEPGAGAAPAPHPELVRNTFKRTHRWDRVLRDQDELALLEREDKLLHVLFSSLPDDMGLYDKPMARNLQMWTPQGELLLDGPSATPEQIRQAMRTAQAGGTFGYRFVFPAMRVGLHEVYWHRPLAAYHCPEKDRTVLIDGAPLGYLTAYPTSAPPSGSQPDETASRQTYCVERQALEAPVELWPRLLRRPLPMATLPLYHQPGKGPATARNVRKLLDAFHLRGGKPLPRDFARHLLTLPSEEMLDGWLESFPDAGVRDSIAGLLEPAQRPGRTRPRQPRALTFGRTARRAFEVAYWKTLTQLAEGSFLNKNNADCVRDPVTERLLPYRGRHLDGLGDFLLQYYRKRIAAARFEGQAQAGELPFRWRTDFDYSWMGGWQKNQERPAERNLLVRIPGRDRSRALIMADHYDTAYMEDRYGEGYGSPGARLAACGADDNHSATAALMLAAPIFLQMSKKGRLGCDVWLVHLTGEEFPADCLGARHLTQSLIEGTLTLHLPDAQTVDLSGVRVQGVYVSDMIAHNNDRERDVFQISPGTGRTSLWLAEQASEAAAIWNRSVPAWNERPERKGKPRGRRSPYGNALPEIAPHPVLHGQVRPVTDPQATLYNTDGQIFSDAGVPVVLFMENYDINRHGYHDTRDTMENIDLDYGAAVAAIVIESVARAAAADPEA
jgi:peptidase M28-like protein